MRMGARLLITLLGVISPSQAWLADLARIGHHPRSADYTSYTSYLTSHNLKYNSSIQVHSSIKNPAKPSNAAST